MATIQKGDNLAQQGNYAAAVAEYSGVISDHADVSRYPTLGQYEWCKIAEALAKRADAYAKMAAQNSSASAIENLAARAARDYITAMVLACQHNCNPGIQERCKSGIQQLSRQSPREFITFLGDDSEVTKAE